MKRRDVLIRLGLLAGGLGAAWWVRDNVVWRRPDVLFTGGEAWVDYDEPRASTPTVRATIQGRSIRALIDSGAQYSVIDRELFRELGLSNTFEMPVVAYGVGGQPQLGQGVTLDLEAAGLEIAGMRAAILGLGPLAEAESLGTSLILGQDLLSRVVMEIEPARRRLRLLPPDTPPPADVHPVAVRRAERSIRSEITIEGAVVEAVVDTGASAILALGRQAAQGAGLLDGRPSERGGSIVLGGTVAATVVTARTVTFGDVLYRAVPVAIYGDVAVPGFPDALIGMDAFEERRLVMDMGGGRLWASRPMELTVGRP